MLKRYGWIAILAVVFLLSAGRRGNEYKQAQTRAEAETLGRCDICAAASAENYRGRAAAFENIEAIAPAPVPVFSCGDAASGRGRPSGRDRRSGCHI